MFPEKNRGSMGYGTVKWVTMSKKESWNDGMDDSGLGRAFSGVADQHCKNESWSMIRIAL